ncbi:MAG: tRNA (adenosine(37)-N6)-threonylcarbamoyltransferase complex ATPase subunit type 1 TsaE [Candidatus Ryanbacteria bacterium RIFCSPHIGHO2_02_FULL_48_12]|uniref:tRNA threonylcarbamoyladenosine biosynthesis protein TsaE n=1 Tax=Candidatus Ryanbacteria bacterium RIFCSPHIGHO2_01_FULL_48_27 TaxID=1802115 RepID=A0A1G2G7F2_9BACT|nr:MAG: tRNA (adenosine(37)-N6)-threonylcarbamoyltransferase complex ATPase subunit type 1 TsaE [Candidatus Ryanbacteria bacterium RIFCSPHIGHO2_01_FULL_48_27]OGZ49170.1 MAG: tRNA (adenosine(37)-N6)-threonylcarbamoyltransferase complex ATPase subunit type 1 TsaE [Candidatus Ryanbacteria bacterium RIFCSPHIGHO2_02_FULL_48_12]
MNLGDNNTFEVLPRNLAARRRYVSWPLFHFSNREANATMCSSMETITLTTTSASATQKAAHILAEELGVRSLPAKGALVLALEGDLGGGKTTFTQGFAKGLGIKDKIASPTFVLMKIYKISGLNTHFERFVHIDAYRLDHPHELVHLGWRDLARDPHNIILVEWASKVKKLIPKEAVHIQFAFVDKKTRTITVKA